jgi:membrane-bound metal-dependent hydrolase YbcI (DUF457 family)
MVAHSIALIALGVVLLVLASTSAGVVPILAGVVGLVAHVLVTRRNTAREAAIE